MHVSNDQIQNFRAICGVMNYLTQLRGKKENIVRFVTVEISQEEESGFRELCFQEMIVTG